MGQFNNRHLDMAIPNFNKWAIHHHSHLNIMDGTNHHLSITNTLIIIHLILIMEKNPIILHFSIPLSMDFSIPQNLPNFKADLLSKDLHHTITHHHLHLLAINHLTMVKEKDLGDKSITMRKEKKELKLLLEVNSKRWSQRSVKW